MCELELTTTHIAFFSTLQQNVLTQNFLFLSFVYMPIGAKINNKTLQKNTIVEQQNFTTTKKPKIVLMLLMIDEKHNHMNDIDIALRTMMVKQLI
ncbi:hypothetical protein D3C80_1651410 [compost metagenome]